MGPFDIHEALSGKPVITRSGLKVTNVLYSARRNENIYEVVGQIHTAEGVSNACFTIEGKYISEDDFEHPLDLFMSNQKWEEDTIRPELLNKRIRDWI